MKDHERDELFARARRVASPTDDDRRRVRAALTRKLGVAGAAGVVVSASVGTTTANAASVAPAGAAAGAATPALAVGASTLIVVKVVVAAVVMASVTFVLLPVRRASMKTPETTSVERVRSQRQASSPSQRESGRLLEDPAASSPSSDRLTGPAVTETPAARTPVGSTSSRIPENLTVSPRGEKNPVVELIASSSSVTSETGAASQDIPTGGGIAATSDEVRLVAEMQLALRAGDTAHVLELVADHERRFPASAWSPEREGARVLALCGSRDGRDERRLAQKFLEAHPRSPLAARVRAACGVNSP